MPLGAALYTGITEVKLLIGCGGFTAYQFQTNSECCYIFTGVRLWVLRSVAERERTQTIG